MTVHSSDGFLVATPDARANRHTVSILRWLILSAAGVFALLLAISHAASVGAAAPTTYDSTICINYFTCYNTGSGTPVSNTNSGYPTYPVYVAPNTTSSGYPANTVVSTYFDPRYCNGVVSVVTDPTGNLIDVCAATGQRIFPVFPDYGNGFGFGSGFVGANFVNGNYYNGNFANGFVNNGCPVGNFSCLGSFPFFGGFPFYSTGTFSGNTTVVTIGGGKPIAVGTPYRVKEVAQPAATTAQTAPMAAPVAPAVNTATALNTSNAAPATAPAATTGDGAGIHVLSASPATTPAVSKDADDHRG